MEFRPEPKPPSFAKSIALMDFQVKKNLPFLRIPAMDPRIYRPCIFRILHVPGLDYATGRTKAFRRSLTDFHSTVTTFARFLGLSTSSPLSAATKYANNCSATEAGITISSSAAAGR